MEGWNAPKNVHECTFYSALLGEFQKIVRLQITQHVKSKFLTFASSITIQRSKISTIVN